MNEGLPNTLFFLALSVFAKYSFSISWVLALEITCSLSNLSSLQISEMLGSVAGSLPS